MDEFQALEQYEKIDLNEVHKDFQKIIGDVLDARKENRPYTASQLPEGFTVQDLDNFDFGFEASKEYTELTMDVRYEERSGGMFGEKDSSTVEVEVDDHIFTENWKHGF
ncbi:MAG: hypothetical protein ACLFRK_01170 [Candidatus Nanohaloarchaea archaeon]